MRMIDNWTSTMPGEWEYLVNILEHHSKIFIIIYDMNYYMETIPYDKFQELLRDTIETSYESCYMHGVGFETFGDLVASAIFIHQKNTGDRFMLTFTFQDDFESEFVRPPVTNIKWEPLGKGMEVLFDIQRHDVN